MSSESNQIQTFGPFTLDRAEARLTRDGTPVSLPPKVFELLCYMTANAGRLIEKHELLKGLWPDSFVEEANLTVGIAALRKALGAEWIETIPKRGYRFRGEVRAQAALPKIEPPPYGRAGRTGWGRRYWGLAAVVLIVIASAVVLWRRTSRVMDASPLTIAVLPFAELSGGDENAHIGLGMADALITRLSASHELVVRPITTVRKYDPGSVDPLAAARELGANVAVFGTVQRVDKRIRMNVQLARVSDGRALWSDQFDEFFTNLFAVQDAISEKLAKTLALRLSSEEQDRMVRRYTESTEAFRLYEMGRYSTFTAPAEALNYFEAALKEDPRYALPYVDEAFLHANLAGGGGSHFTERMPLARAAAKRGLELAPDYADAHAATAVVLHYADRNYSGADREIEAALKLNPQSARAHDRRAELLAIRGNLENALIEEQMAAKLDPFNGEIIYNLAWLQYCSRRYDQAVATMKEFEKRDPRARNIYIYFHSAIAQHRYEDALALLEERGGEHFTVELGRAYVYGLAGKHDEARRRVRAGPPNERSYERAVVYMALGDLDAAFERLNRAIDEHSIWAEWFRVDPALDPIRQDPRFPPLIKRMGLE